MRFILPIIVANEKRKVIVLRDDIRVVWETDYGTYVEFHYRTNMPAVKCTSSIDDFKELFNYAN